MKESVNSTRIFLSLLLCALLSVSALSAAEDQKQVYASGFVGAGIDLALTLGLTVSVLSSLTIGAVVIVGGYVVYRIATTKWTYYSAYSYSKMSSHAYDHINDFPNLWWPGPPKQDDFKKKCKSVINSKTSSRYLQPVDGRTIAFDLWSEMLVVGETDGSTIVTCYRMSAKDVAKKVANALWKRI